MLCVEVVSQVGVVSDGEVAVDADGLSVGGVARVGATVCGLGVDEPPHASVGQAVGWAGGEVADVDHVDVVDEDDVDELGLGQLVVDGEDVWVRRVRCCVGKVARVGVVRVTGESARVWVSGEESWDGSVMGAVVVTVVPGSSDGSVESNGLPARKSKLPSGSVDPRSTEELAGSVAGPSSAGSVPSSCTGSGGSASGDEPPAAVVCDPRGAGSWPGEVNAGRRVTRATTATVTRPLPLRPAVRGAVGPTLRPLPPPARPCLPTG